MVSSSARVGGELTLPNWATWKGATLSVGEAGALLLVEPVGAGAGRYVVTRIVRP